jgi:hypothetical protein
LGFLKCWEVLEQLHSWQFLEKGSAPGLNGWTDERTNKWENSCEEMKQRVEEIEGIKEGNCLHVIFDKSCASSDVRRRICEGHYENLSVMMAWCLGFVQA